MFNLSRSQKGAAAEAEVAASAIKLGFVVLRPMCEGGRYDLAIDIGAEILRVQCKWASLHGDVLNARCMTSRHTPRGYRRSTYSGGEVDAIGIYAQATDGCYLIPIAEVAGLTMISLRIGPPLNNQSRRVRWAHAYEMSGSLEHNWQVTWPAIRISDTSTAEAVGYGHPGL